MTSTARNDDAKGGGQIRIGKVRLGVQTENCTVLKGAALVGVFQAPVRHKV